MVDLFAGIPEEVILGTLDTIRVNLYQIGLSGGHTVRKHTDIQVQILKKRLTMEDIRFATSFWDMEIAQAVVQELLQRNYDEEIAGWLRMKGRDCLPLYGRFPRSIGYGLKKGDNRLKEDLRRACLTLIKDEQADWGFRVLTSYPVF
ncbi:MAG: RNase A-like domain-containing protein [Frisingicoccus sp.]